MREKRIENEKIIKPKGKAIITLLSFLSLITCGFTVYNLLNLKQMGGSIPKYIYLMIAIVVSIYLIIFIFTKKKMSKQKKLKRNIAKKGIYTSLIIYIIITSIISGIIFYIYNYIGSFNKEYITYSSSLITLSKKDCDSVNDVNDYIIGILSDKKSTDGYIIPREIIKEKKLEDENEIVYYDSYQEMMTDLYNEEIDAIFITTNYEPIFNSIEAYSNIKEETKIIITKEKKVKKKDVSTKEISSRGKNITEPFTILLMGVDSPDEGLEKNTAAHGDSLILITFNPKTLNATMLSIPRDSYVPIACWKDKAENKITHAAVYGNDCMMNTIEEYFDITIDYYAKINFKGLVGLVDALGGIDVEVPKDLCTDNSNREEEVCISKGWQHLNGEGALVLTRNRKQLAAGDLDRGRNQQLVIEAMLNKIKTVKSTKQFLKILNTISNNFDTNFTTDQILSFYSIAEDLLTNDLAKEDGSLVTIDQLYLQGSGQSIYDERAKMILWNYIPNEQSRKDIIEAMKINLGKEKHSEEKEFSFSINEEYEKETIGDGPYKNNSNYTLLPSFIGYSQTTAQAMATKLGVKVTFVGTGGTVIRQSEPASKRIDKLTGAVQLTLSKNSNSNTSEEKNNTQTKSKSSTSNEKDEEKKEEKKEEKNSEDTSKKTTDNNEEEE